LLRAIAGHIGIDPSGPWSHGREIVFASDETGPPPPPDALRDHYRVHDEALASKLGTSLPWRA
jgi:hypothetical protein